MKCRTCKDREATVEERCAICYAVENNMARYVMSETGLKFVQIVAGMHGQEELNAKVMHLNKVVKDLRDDHNQAGDEADTFHDEFEKTLAVATSHDAHFAEKIANLDARVESLERKVYRSS